MAALLKSERFEVTLQGSYTIILPIEIVNIFTEKGFKRAKVKAFFNKNSIEFYAALQKRKEKYILTFSKRYQKQLGIFPSDYFQLQLYEDTSKYGVEMPEELEAVLQSDPEAYQIFESFSDGKKRTLIYYILKIKTSQIRIDKALLISENIKMGIIDPKELIKAH